MLYPIGSDRYREFPRNVEGTDFSFPTLYFKFEDTPSIRRATCDEARLILAQHMGTSLAEMMESLPNYHSRHTTEH